MDGGRRVGNASVPIHAQHEESAAEFHQYGKRITDWRVASLYHLQRLWRGPRSWRLRELFAGDRVFSVSDFEREIGQDAVNVAIRDFRTLVLAIANEDGDTTEELARAIEYCANGTGSC